MVLNYDCPDDVLVSRLLARAQHSGRTDDNEETIKKRLELFHSKTQPVIEHYANIVFTVSWFCCSFLVLEVANSSCSWTNICL